MSLSIRTFSRGGAISVLVVLFAGFAVLLEGNKVTGRQIKWIGIAGMISLCCIIAFGLVDEYSGGKITKRYFEKQSMHNRPFSGRSAFVKADLKIFEDNMLYGCGIGRSTQTRKKYIKFPTKIQILKN